MDQGLYQLMFALFRIAGRLPPVVLRMTGRMIGEVLFWIDRRHRTITRKNIRFAYGDELTEAQVQTVARDGYRHLGQVALETMRLLVVPPARLRRQVGVHGLANARRALAQGRGVIFVTSHCGLWELTSLMSGLLLGRGLVVVNPLNFRPLDRVLTALRTRWGHRVTPRQGAMRPLLRELRAQGGVGILADQDAHWAESVVVPFFGRPSRTNKGLALLWMATHAPVVPTYTYFDQGRWHLVFGEPLALKRLPDKTATLEAAAREINAALEAAIRLHLDQWLWMHHRWRIYYD